MVELSANTWYIFAILGVLAGILSGALGVGSGILLVPVLVILFNCPQKSAQGIALAVMVPMAVVGAMRYKLNPEINVDLRLAGVLAVGAVLGSLIGSEIAIRLPTHILRKAFAIFVLVAAIKMFTAPARETPVTPPPAINVEGTNTHGDQ